MRVLVVEDTAQHHSDFSASLQRYQYRVDRVADGYEALNQASLHYYDLIILDLTLPTESSLLVLHEIREFNQAVGILILSTEDQIRDRITALIQGADDYLVKPFSSDDLQARIQSLAKRRADQLAASPAIEPAFSRANHLNGLIENLFNHSHYNPDQIELVISETKLTGLLARVVSNLDGVAAQKSIRIHLPEPNLLTLLVDARWMEHLLTNLISQAILGAQSDAEIHVSSQARHGYCSLEIEVRIDTGDSGDELHTSTAKKHGQFSATALTSALIPSALATACADCMNLNLQAALSADSLPCLRISNIKLV